MTNEKKTGNQPIALCLSGGGYRAALFHLGVLRRLNELSILTAIDTITSVSGGSILSAHLADCYSKNPPGNGPYPEFENRVAAPFRRFCQRDIRTVPILKRILPWNWLLRSTQVNALMSRYGRYLTSLKLSELPRRPEFVFCATDVVFGKNWEFRRDEVGDYKTRKIDTPADWTLARAVAASSCFPPLFDPMKVGKDFLKGKIAQSGDRGKTKKALLQLRLSDGGVYDNLGLEPAKNHFTVIASDGGAPFRVFTAGSALRLWLRYFDVASDQVGSLRKRMLFNDADSWVKRDGQFVLKKQAVALPIGKGSTDDNDASARGYDDKLVESHISRVRTDLDGFTDEEIGVLENHGYLLANRITKKYCPQLVDSQWPPLVPPHPEMFDEAWVKKNLENSSKRVCPSRIFRRWKQVRAREQNGC